MLEADNKKPTTNRFSKEEHLCSRKIIEAVALTGKSIVNHPFRLRWVLTELKTKYPAQIALSVPKKAFKRAVDRNRIKRLMREVYRKNKGGFYEQLKERNKQCALLLAYIGKTIPTYNEVEDKIPEILKRLEENIIVHSR